MRHRVFVPTASGYRGLKDVFTGPRAVWHDDISSRTLYLSRVERNRLAHSVNGNTATAEPSALPRTPGRHWSRTERNRLAHALNCSTSTPAEGGRGYGASAYLSAKLRNRLAHTEHGNTSKQLSPQELYDSLVSVPVQQHRCKGRPPALAPSSWRSSMDGLASAGLGS